MPTVFLKRSSVAFRARAASLSMSLTVWKYSSAPLTICRRRVLLTASFLWKLSIHSMAVHQSWETHLAFSLPSTSTQVTSSRRRKVQVRPLSSVPHSLAMPGTSLPWVSTSTRKDRQLLSTSRVEVVSL